MQQNGLAKLAEECGEVLQIIGKLLQYPELQLDQTAKHPDRTTLLVRLEEELGDLNAVIRFVNLKLGLDTAAILRRGHLKLEQFQKWDGE
jgi:NTP pyrophosphatase (non-canonical NTP hydrolase)